MRQHGLHLTHVPEHFINAIVSLLLFLNDIHLGFFQQQFNDGLNDGLLVFKKLVDRFL